MFNLPERIHNTPLLLQLIATCIVVFFFPTQSAAAKNTIDSLSEFQTTDCWIKPNSKAQTDCGWFTVPEDWTAAKSQKLKLPVVIYQPLNPDPSLDPVIYLAGGPGYPALGYKGGHISGWRRTADSIFPGRRLIVFDQRGTGLSTPKLECHDGDGSMVWYPVSRNTKDFGDIPSRVHTAYAHCAERHITAGRQLSAYNSLQIATDTEALRRALKLKSVVLFGISYGTRLALTVMKLYPENISAAILDSVLPPQSDNAAYNSNRFGAVLDRLFQACQRDEGCALAFPDLRDQFQGVLKHLSKEPAIVEITNMTSSGPLYVRIDETMFLSVLHAAMYNLEKHAVLPLLISEAFRGEYGELKYHVEYSVDNHYGLPDSFDMGATLAITCNDDARETSWQTNADNTTPYPYLDHFVNLNHETWPCAIWPTKPETRNRDAVVSDIPSLLLAGALDPATTVEHAEIAAETLSKSHLFIFPANGHVQSRGKCSSEIIGEFLDTPSKRPNPACLKSLRQPVFITEVSN